MTSVSRMAGRVQVKYRRHSEDLRKTAVHNSMCKRQGSLSRVNSSISDPQDGFRPASVPPPLYPKNARRHTIASVDLPLLSPRQPSLDRQGFCSPKRRSNPHPARLTHQRPYHRHNKVWQGAAGIRSGFNRYLCLNIIIGSRSDACL